VIGLAAGLAVILGQNIWSSGALPVVVTLVGWLMAIPGAGLLALSTNVNHEALRRPALRTALLCLYGATRILGAYSTYAAFSA